MARKHPDVPLVIDFHTHMLDAELREICTSRNAITGFGKKQAPPSANLQRFLDPELQVADMDERGIDMHVVFTGPVHMAAWWADARTARQLAARMNESIAGWVARFPKRFVGTVTLPMQDVGLAVAELKRGITELGHRAVMLPTNVDGVYLFATCMGRLDRNIEKAEARVNIGYKKPSEYPRHFYYDTCLYDPLAMQTLFKRVGTDRMVLGSDYPVGGSDPVGEIKQAIDLSNEDLHLVAGGRAAELLGLKA